MNIQQQRGARSIFLYVLLGFALVFYLFLCGSSDNYAHASQTVDVESDAELNRELYPLNFPEDGMFIDDETEENVAKLEEKHKIKVPNLLRDIYAKRVDIEKAGYVGESEGEILVGVLPCLSTGDKCGDDGYMSIDRVYTWILENTEETEETIPKNYLPFAMDGFGNYHYLDLNNPASTDIIYGIDNSEFGYDGFDFVVFRQGVLRQ
ncbi:MAG: SMI1/KNR4 family protein [Candidatus Ancillula sp.]|jgi:hypothetical protein|nr:SMI1/KNR4 family protein [Candidatus Ancillula sp.]